MRQGREGGEVALHGVGVDALMRVVALELCGGGAGAEALLGDLEEVGELAPGEVPANRRRLSVAGWWTLTASLLCVLV